MPILYYITMEENKIIDTINLFFASHGIDQVGIEICDNKDNLVASIEINNYTRQEIKIARVVSDFYVLVTEATNKIEYQFYVKIEDMVGSSEKGRFKMNKCYPQFSLHLEINMKGFLEQMHPLQEIQQKQNYIDALAHNYLRKCELRILKKKQIDELKKNIKNKSKKKIDHQRNNAKNNKTVFVDSFKRQNINSILSANNKKQKIKITQDFPDGISEQKLAQLSTILKLKKHNTYCQKIEKNYQNISNPNTKRNSINDESSLLQKKDNKKQKSKQFPLLFRKQHNEFGSLSFTNFLELTTQEELKKQQQFLRTIIQMPNSSKQNSIRHTAIQSKRHQSNSKNKIKGLINIYKIN